MCHRVVKEGTEELAWSDSRDCSCGSSSLGDVYRDEMKPAESQAKRSKNEHGKNKSISDELYND